MPKVGIGNINKRDKAFLLDLYQVEYHKKYQQEYESYKAKGYGTDSACVLAMQNATDHAIFVAKSAVPSCWGIHLICQ